jgi:hypothetical protein
MKIPKNETVLQTYVFDGIECYAITRNMVGRYTLYKATNGDYQKMKMSESPLEFDKVIEKDRS